MGTMANRPDVPVSINEALESQRATSAAPGLSPFVRAAMDLRGYRQQHQNALLEDARKRAEISPDGNRPRTSKEAQLGKGMWGHHLRTMLKKLCPSVIFETSPVMGGVYIARTRISDPVLGKTLQYVVGFPQGFMPEFSTIVAIEEEYMDLETKTIKKRYKPDPKNCEIRGWRTVLARFLAAGLLTESQVFRNFGAPTHDSERWQRQIGGVQ